MENQILSRFKFTHVSQKIEKVLPQCFSDEVFAAWAKFVHLLNRCLKKCFDGG